MSKLVAVSCKYSQILALICMFPAFVTSATPQSDRAEKTKRSEQPAEAPVTLSFPEFFDPDNHELKPSAKLLSLNGKRVRLVGFMARMEKPPKGVFYLCSRPVFSDESGGGTGDLPVDHVRVIMQSAKNKEIPHIARPIEVTGILEIGNREEDDGTVSAIRLLLDAPRTLSGSPVGSPKKQRRKT